MFPRFDLQGHRGARGLKPENTLPAVELAFDLGVTSIEADVQLTCDGVPILFHDEVVSEQLCRLTPGSDSPDPSLRPAIGSLTLAQLRGYRADRNPDPNRFPQQDASVTPLSERFAQQLGIDPYTPPTVAELFAFADAYQGICGEMAGKTQAQRERLQHTLFDLEIKSTPFRPQMIGVERNYVGDTLLPQRLVEVIESASAISRTRIRSFVHSLAHQATWINPQLTVGILVAGTAPLFPATLAEQARAELYCPDFEFLREADVRQLHEKGIAVLPWTVNEAADWECLLSWGVDGITTDFPDRLAAFLNERRIAF
jgi:glycerophosphoryl diester phosphodiesterase